jgi:periplasmic protein TonB
MSRISLPNTFSNISSQAPLRLENHFEIIEWLKEKSYSENFIAFSIVIMLHLTALFGLFYNFNNNSAQPILSFTVTMMDVSATSSNIVSTAASTASKSDAKISEKIKESQNSNTATILDTSQSLAEGKKSKAAQSYNSAEQTAVVAPTTPALFDAAYLNNSAPTYPPLSRRLEEQGTVILSVFVDNNGQAQNVVVKKSSGFDRLDVAALETVKKWRFSPAKNGDKIVASWVQVPVSFVLEK